MSVQIAPPEVFKDAKENVLKLVSRQGFHLPYSLKDYFPLWYANRGNFDKAVQYEVEQWFENLKKLNVYSYFGVYRHHYDNIEKEKTEQMSILNSPFPGYSKVNDHTLYKHLCYIAYQIEIRHCQNLGDNVVKSAKALDLFIVHLATYIVEKNEKYKNALWGERC